MTVDDGIEAACDGWKRQKKRLAKEAGIWKWRPDLERMIEIYNAFHEWCSSHEATQRAFLKQRKIANRIAHKPGDDGAVFRKAHKWLRLVPAAPLSISVS
jgi:hypothetical protein